MREMVEVVVMLVLVSGDAAARKSVGERRAVMIRFGVWW